eukprot:TRINITY_DN2354_c0_g1_i1.p1 TRINITY_DN2354_c0_g1~~TRINITY_DN2354_c0_g1_i1.p1  ORF type:complete len:392 (-),score=56.59 TRINITY_DN2354_c0_g1_i1:96-1271(-)
MVLGALTLLSFVFGALSQTVLYEWVSLDYDWYSEEQKQSYIADGRFIVSNNSIAGIKVWQNQIFVTVPRWKDGVPSTLNKVVYKDNKPVLQPYPSWEWQQIGNPNKLQYIQSMEIDSRGWMWILDVSRIDLVGPGQPKLLIWDLVHNCSIRVYHFPSSTFPLEGSFANDIVVDETNGYAYISNTWDKGGIIVYDFNRNLSRRFGDHPSLLGNASNVITINGLNYAVANPTDGIALSHDTKKLYYCSLSGTLLWSVPTFILQNFSATDQDIGRFVGLVGTKGYSDGMTYADGDVLYFGKLEDSAVMEWDVTTPLSSARVVVSDSFSSQWPDTFAWDLEGYLYFVSNKLQKFLFGQMKFDGSDGANFRIWRVYTGMKSYLTGNPVPAQQACTQ